MYVYYAKFNINSDLEELKKDKAKLKGLLSKLAHELDTNAHKYQYTHLNEYSVNSDEVDENGNEIKKKIVEKETYRFLKINRYKESHGDIIIGELMREKPDSIKIYNKKTHEIVSTGISERAFSTVFIFDLLSETIAFTERKGLGRKQFVIAFEEISKVILQDQAVRVILKHDPRDFVDRVRELSRVNQINVEIISPNFVDKELDEIEEEAKKIGEEMDEQNITKMEYYLETSEQNKKGIDLEGKYAKEILYKFSIMGFLGYSKATISGFIGRNEKTLKSEKDSPMVTVIKYEDRENSTTFKNHVLDSIKGEAARRTIRKKKTKRNNRDESASNE